MNKNTKIKLIALGFPLYAFTLMMLLYIMVSIIGFTIYHKDINLNDDRFMIAVISMTISSLLSIGLIAGILTNGKPPANYICDSINCYQKAVRKFKPE